MNASPAPKVIRRETEVIYFVPQTLNLVLTNWSSILI